MFCGTIWGDVCGNPTPLRGGIYHPFVLVGGTICARGVLTALKCSIWEALQTGFAAAALQAPGDQQRRAAFGANLQIAGGLELQSPRPSALAVMCAHMDVAQNLRARVMQVLVFGSIYQGAILVHVFGPQPYAPNDVTTLLFQDHKQNMKAP